MYDPLCKHATWVPQYVIRPAAERLAIVQRGDKSRLFVELNRDGVDELRREIAERMVSAEKTWWGCDAIRIVDPDGNELLFPLDETNDRERQRSR